MATATTERVIRADEIYAKDEFLKRTGFTKSAWLAALRNGLQTLKAGKRTYVRGEDWFAYLSRS